MTVRLYLDEDAMDHSLVRALRTRGVDVVTALDVGLIQRADEEHLEFAASQGRTLYSFNKGDYMSLHVSYLQQEITHAGIIFTDQQHYSVGEQMRRILKIIAVRSAQDMQNHVEFLSAWGR